MTHDQYKGLVELLTIRFDRLDARLDALVDRLTRLALNLESMRDDLRTASEPVAWNSRKIE